jgi:DNA-binding transcriptional MerR regulator
MNSLGPFTSRQAVTLSRVSPKTLHYWCTTVIVVPSVKPPRGPGRGQNKQLLYSFRDVVAARTATELRKCGISLQALRRAVAQLKRQKHAINPRAEDRLVVAPDGDVLGIQPPDKALSLMERPAELIFYNLNYG